MEVKLEKGIIEEKDEGNCTYNNDVLVYINSSSKQLHCSLGVRLPANSRSSTGEARAVFLKNVCTQALTKNGLTGSRNNNRC